MFSAADCRLRGLNMRLACGGCSQSSLGTTASSVTGLAATTRLAALDTLVWPANITVIATADTANLSGVTKIGVDSNEFRSHPTSADIVNDDAAWAPSLVVRAVAAASVQLSRVGDSVVANGHSSTAVGLDDFVRCASGATALNKNVASSKCSNSV